MAVAGKKKKIFDDRYEISSIVGRGAQSVVYRARHIDGDQHEVALKVLLKPKSAKISGSDLLRKEALAMVSSRHKYVIRLDDFHSVDDLCYLSMEYAPEADLRKYTKKLGGNLPVDLAERYISQIAEAMNFIHLAGILHRDIKPDNILVVDEGSIRLGDFGVAVLPGEESSLDELQSGVGTMDYMAPEVLAGTGYDQRADIYGVGVIFYELLGGTHPFENTPLAQQLNVRQEGAFPHISEIAPEVPVYLGDVIMKAMAYDPDTRYQTARELLQDLKNGRAESGVSERPTPVAHAEKPPVAPEPQPAPVPEPPQREKARQERPEKPAAERPEQPPVEQRTVTAEPPQRSQPPLTEQIEVEKTKPKPSSGSRLVDNSPTADPLGAVESNPKSLKRRRKKRRSRTGIRSTRQGTQQSKQRSSKPPVDEDILESEVAPESEIILAEPPEQTSSGTGAPASSPSMSPAPGHTGPGLQLGAQVVQSAYGEPAAEATDPAPPEPAPIEPTPVEPEPVVMEPESPSPEPVAAQPMYQPEPDATAYTPEPVEPEIIEEPAQPATTVPPHLQEDTRPNRAFTAAAFAAGATDTGFPGQEEALDPLEKKRASKKSSAKRSVKSKRKRSSKRKSSSKSQGGLNPILMAGLALLVLFVVYPRLQSMFSGGEEEYILEEEYVEQTGAAPAVFSESAEPIRAESINVDQFPLLPSGVYGGSLSGVMPGGATPITVISLRENDALTIILGIPGWTPVTFSYQDLRKEFEKTSLNRLKFASNGLVIELIGEAQNGELIGELKNITTGEIGQWSLVPIR